MPEITVTEHLLATQMKWSPQATGQFTSLLHDLIVSAKIISRNVKQAGLVDILGGTGEVNVQGERVQKLDEFANQTLVYRMRTCGAVCALGSEELEEPLIIPENGSHGSYIIFFDPLDGSSNIDVNVSIGTIFSIYRRSEGATDAFRGERMLRPCCEQVAAGYFLYGPSTMMVYTTGHGVHGFTLDPSVGEFLLSHPDIQIASHGSIYSVNVSNDSFWDEATRECVDCFCHPDKGDPYSLRYVGSLVADFHRTLLYGGIFLYPADSKKPSGKLRLMYEAAPMAFLAEQAGGKATDGVCRILDKKPRSIHERTPLVVGSPEDVDRVSNIYRKHGRAYARPHRGRIMLVLGVESSCDETALALVGDDGVAASVMATQADLHALFGGVVPELASREHARLIGPLLDELWRASGLTWNDVDRIAVTRGPGLLGSLLVGLAFAKALALGRGLPLIGVNHLHAHLLAAGLPPDEERLAFPALGVLVSGGHTHLYRMDGPTALTALGRTVDDAAGEACDKFAKMAGLPYPGGALLDALGRRGEADPRLFPRPYIHNDNLDFSFSGLKTAGAAWLAAHPDARFPAGEAPVRERLGEAPQALCDAAASYLLAVAETLGIKARRAAALFRPRTLVVAGGVAANSVVRRVFSELADEWSVPLLVPAPALCTDNGVMVAWNGLLLARAGLYHGPDLSAVPRGRAIPEDWRKV